jgi:hypothetical protein
MHYHGLAWTVLDNHGLAWIAIAYNGLPSTILDQTGAL